MSARCSAAHFGELFPLRTLHCSYVRARLDLTIVPDTPKSIGILGFNGVKAWDLTGALETFTAADACSEHQTRHFYDVKLVAVAGRSFVSESGILIKTKQLLSSFSSLDTIVIPGGNGLHHLEAWQKLTQWIQSSTVRRTVMIGAGVYPVAQSGLLDGRKIATHWRLGRDLAARFPTVSVDTATSFIRDGSFYSCGGGTALAEMVLAMIEEDYGPSVALPAARELVMRIRPFGDVNSTNEISQFQYGPIDRLADLPAWISAHLNENLSVENLASRACVCPRHFGRIFKRYFKTTPAHYVERARLDEARRRLKSTRNSIEYIARAIGFAHVDSFRRAFERHYKMSPLVYRKESQARSSRRERQGLAAA